MARKTDTFLLQSQSLFSSSYDSKDSALKDTTVDTALNSDMFMASAAIFIVLVLIWAHTGSLLLTFGGMLQVLLAFPSAVFLTTTVFQIKFFPFLNFIGAFAFHGFPPTVYRPSLSALLVMYVALPALVTTLPVLVMLTNISQVHCLLLLVDCTTSNVYWRTRNCYKPTFAD